MTFHPTGPLNVASGGTGNGGTATGNLSIPVPLVGFGVDPSGAEALTSGETICPRVVFAANAISLTTQVMILSYWTAVTSGTATTVTTVSGGTAAAGLTLAKVGIYSVAANGNITLLVATADLHATIWASTFTTYNSALSANFTRVAGQKYAMAVLAVGTTPPSLAGPSNSSTYGLAPISGGTVGGQADLPASVASGSITGGFQFVAGAVSP